MQFFLLASFLPLLGLTSAAPSLPVYRITPRVNNNGTAATNGTAAAKTTQLTFTGAGAKFEVNAPVDGSNFQIRTSVLGFTPPPPKFLFTSTRFLTKPYGEQRARSRSTTSRRPGRPAASSRALTVPSWRSSGQITQRRWRHRRRSLAGAVGKRRLSVDWGGGVLGRE